MNVLRLTSAALIAAAGFGLAGAANAAPASNLSADPQATQRDDSAVTPVWHRYHYGYYDYYYYPRYHYYPRYYYRPYHYYGYPYYYGPTFNFGFTIR